MEEDSVNIWGEEDASEEPSSSHSLDIQREWETRRVQFQNLGYRDGITAGKQSSVQEGFNQGFKEAARAGFSWGVCRGALRAYGALPPALQSKLMVDEGARERLEALDSTISHISSADAMELYYSDAVLRGSRYEPATTLSAVQARGAQEGEPSGGSITNSRSEESCSTERDHELNQPAERSNASCESKKDGFKAECSCHKSLEVAHSPSSGQPNAYVQRVTNPNADIREVEDSTTSHLMSMTLRGERSRSSASQVVGSVSRLEQYQKSLEDELQGSGINISEAPLF